MTLDTDESGLDEAPESDEEVTIFTDDDEDEIIVLEDNDLPELFDEEEEDEEDESGDKDPVPYGRFEKKVKIAKQWETKAKTAEDALEAFKKEAGNAADPLQHYVDAGIDNPSEISKRDMQLVSTLALVAEQDPQVKAILESVIKQTKLGGTLKMDKETKSEPAGKVEDERVTEMLKADARRQTETIVDKWAATPKKIALREIASHLDLTKPVTSTEITAGLKRVLKDYSFTKEDIFGADGKKKKSKAPTAGKKASLTSSTKKSEVDDEKTALKKMTSAELSKHLKDRMRSFIDEADEEEF